MMFRAALSARAASRAVRASHAIRPASLAIRPASSAPSFDAAAFTDRFLREVEDVPAATDPAQSAAALRRLVRSGVLKFTDMADDPDKFFLAHRLLSTVGLGGFGIRFTVQFNLFAGSIVGLAGPDQRAMLDEFQRAGDLGCFLLTERQAGVLSGLIVETTATWNDDAQAFELHTPRPAAAKNWISQGFVATRGVVVADLVVGGRSHGPHAFVMRLRDDATGALLPGIAVEDMGIKTVANDLDNARVTFDRVPLPRSALLNKFADISPEGAYVQVDPNEKMRIEVIGQRLLTGRMVIAQAALLCARTLHMRTEAYAATKTCNGLAGEVPLGEMPQLKAVLSDGYARLDAMLGFAAAVERRLSATLKAGAIPDDDLVDAISVCKIRCIDAAIEATHALRKEVGSFALMHGSGFELADMLLCCKFAEGDSRILQQKLARDRLRALQRRGLVGAAADALLPGPDAAEARAALRLARALAPAGRDRDKLAAAMDANWREVYELAELVADRHIRDAAQGVEFPEGPVVERFRAAATGFDADWKAKLGAADERAVAAAA